MSMDEIDQLQDKSVPTPKEMHSNGEGPSAALPEQSRELFPDGKAGGIPDQIMDVSNQVRDVSAPKSEDSQGILVGSSTALPNQSSQLVVGERERGIGDNELGGMPVPKREELHSIVVEPFPTMPDQTRQLPSERRDGGSPIRKYAAIVRKGLVSVISSIFSMFAEIMLGLLIVIGAILCIFCWTESRSGSDQHPQTSISPPPPPPPQLPDQQQPLGIRTRSEAWP